MPREPALLTSAAMDGEAQSASRERSPGWAQRTSGDGGVGSPDRHSGGLFTQLVELLSIQASLLSDLAQTVVLGAGR
jgi:hypothetical protein